VSFPEALQKTHHNTFIVVYIHRFSCRAEESGTWFTNHLSLSSCGILECRHIGANIKGKAWKARVVGVRR